MQKLTERQQQRKKVQDPKGGPLPPPATVLEYQNDGTTERQQPELRGGPSRRDLAGRGQHNGGAAPGAEPTGEDGTGVPGQEEHGLLGRGRQEPRHALSTTPERSPTGPSCCSLRYSSWPSPSCWFEFVKNAERLRKKASQYSGIPSRNSGPQRMAVLYQTQKKQKVKRDPCRSAVQRRRGRCFPNRLPMGTEDGMTSDLTARLARNGPWSEC